MDTIKVAIAEDQARNIEILETILEEHCENVEIVGAEKTVEAAVKMIRKTRPDVLFLDVEMPPHKGFDILDQFSKVFFDVIFITAHEEYAIQAIKFAALDYLLKPLNIDEVKTALSKVRKRQSGNTNELIGILKDYMQNKEQGFSKIVIPANDGYRLVNLNDIIYCEACDSYTKIHIKGEKVQIISKSLKEYDKLLSDKGFFRVHKSYLINMNHIQKIIKGVGAAVIMSDEKTIPISLRKKDSFFQNLKGVIHV